MLLLLREQVDRPLTGWRWCRPHLRNRLDGVEVGWFDAAQEVLLEVANPDSTPFSLPGPTLQGSQRVVAGEVVIARIEHRSHVTSTPAEDHLDFGWILWPLRSLDDQAAISPLVLNALASSTRSVMPTAMSGNPPLTPPALSRQRRAAT
jgi:hypothetical protein